MSGQSCLEESTPRALHLELNSRFFRPGSLILTFRNEGGCPWSCRDSGEGVDYDPDRFPAAQKHGDTHFGMTTPLRAPNGPEVAAKVAEAMRKVFESIDRLDPDEVLGDE